MPDLRREESPPLSVRPHLSAALVPVLALAGAGLVALAAAPARAASYEVVKTETLIKARDGVTLDLSIQRPAVSPPAGTRWPVVVAPATFDGNKTNIDLMTAPLAARGFVTVSFLERGFGKSGGYMDVGGPLDVSDASDVLTWALATQNVDPARVGIIGLSYGAGFVATAAAQDPRFKAVAMLSGWGDMWKSRYPNNTGAYVANLALQQLALRNGRPSPELKSFLQSMVDNVFTPGMKTFADQRSPVKYLDLMAQHPVPLFASTNMNENIWPEDQTLEFFNAYPGVKHADILPGDHATTELTQGFGIPAETWKSAYDWMETYVAGTSTVARTWPTFRVAPRGPDGTNAIESKLFTQFPFESYDRLTVRATKRQYLSSSSAWLGLTTRTTLSDTPGPDGKRLRQGRNLLLQDGIPMAQGGIETATGMPTTVLLQGVDQGVTGLWEGPKLTQKLQLRGAISSHLDLTPSTAKGSVFVYLLEQGPLGLTYVIGVKPYTYAGATPGAKLGVDVTIPYNAYDVPAGHKLIFAVSTDDVTFSSNTPTGSSVVVGSGSYVNLPLK
ncbi:alpha/beta fold hydrolase [Spongisporangium articulatum]|uniref:Alpha/beta fold hydrolase n=1 Tax=Spongisporangium articulatum TaxID=3362603 RepID=A0ABW8AJM2_9ACTN